MSKNLLKKLSTIIGSSEEKSTALDETTKNRLNTVLEEHLDIIAAAHSSTHSSNHGSSTVG